MKLTQKLKKVVKEIKPNCMLQKGRTAEMPNI